MQVRNANNSDLATLARLDKLSNITNWSISDYQNSLHNKQQFIYLVEEHGKILACMVFGIVMDEAEILQFWVESNLKRQGIGLYLLNHTLNQLAKHQNVLRVFLEVRDGNQAAINLYKKVGFVEVGKRHQYYNIDAWQFDALVMHKEFLGFKL